MQLSEEDQAVDETLDALYGDGDEGGFGSSNPDVARWLGSIRTYFPTPVAEMLQQDVIKRVNLRKLIQDAELLESIEPGPGDPACSIEPNAADRHAGDGTRSGAQSGGRAN